MNLKEFRIKISDNVESDGACTIYHRSRSLDIADIIMQRSFSAGKGVGSMYGKGLYANLDSSQVFSQQSRNDYGHIVLEAYCVNLKGFFIFDYETYMKTPEGQASGATEKDHIFKQAEHFGIPTGTGMSNLQRMSEGDYSSEAALKFYNDKISKHAKKTVSGLIYKGRRDALSMVCYFPKLYVVPKALSNDEGKNWVPVDSTSFFQKYFTTNKGQDIKFLKGDERSEVRADNLKEMLIDKGVDEEKYWDHIVSHLIRIADPDKLESRKKLMAKTFPEYSEGIMTFEPTTYRNFKNNTGKTGRSAYNRWVSN